MVGKHWHHHHRRTKKTKKNLRHVNEFEEEQESNLFSALGYSYIMYVYAKINSVQYMIGYYLWQKKMAV